MLLGLKDHLSLILLGRSWLEDAKVYQPRSAVEPIDVSALLSPDCCINNLLGPNLVNLEQTWVLQLRSEFRMQHADPYTGSGV